jgi:hypothetical protein
MNQWELISPDRTLSPQNLRGLEGRDRWFFEMRLIMLLTIFKSLLELISKFFNGYLNDSL